MKPSNNDKNFLIMYLHVDNDNVYEVLHSWHFICNGDMSLLTLLTLPVFQWMTSASIRNGKASYKT